MKTVLLILARLTILPIALIFLFSGMNWLISVVPFNNYSYDDIQNSYIWVLWFFIGLFTIVISFFTKDIIESEDIKW